MFVMQNQEVEWKKGEEGLYAQVGVLFIGVKADWRRESTEDAGKQGKARELEGEE